MLNKDAIKIKGKGKIKKTEFKLLRNKSEDLGEFLQ